MAVSLTAKATAGRAGPHAAVQDCAGDDELAALDREELAARVALARAAVGETVILLTLSLHRY